MQTRAYPSRRSHPRVTPFPPSPFHVDVGSRKSSQPVSFAGREDTGLTQKGGTPRKVMYLPFLLFHHHHHIMAASRHRIVLVEGTSLGPAPPQSHSSIRQCPGRMVIISQPCGSDLAAVRWLQPVSLHGMTFHFAVGCGVRLQCRFGVLSFWCPTRPDPTPERLQRLCGSRARCVEVMRVAPPQQAIAGYCSADQLMRRRPGAGVG